MEELKNKYLMHTHKILIVDDQTEHLEAIVNIIENDTNSYRVLQAFDGLTAIKIAEKEIPDLIITDWEMPGMNGIELIKLLKSKEEIQDIPIIMCTGVMTKSENLATSLKVGAVDYVRKPVDKIELTARINSMLLLSESYKKNAQLLAVSSRLREVDRLKDEFLANTSHELRTPLFGIIGLLEALLDKPSIEDPEDQKLLNTALHSGRRLRKLVTDILDYSKLRHQKLKLALEPVELHSLVDVVLRLCKPMITERNLELVNAIEPGSLHVQADEIRIEQVLHNLVGNAIKFTEQGKIEVRAEQQGDKILVQVSDSGIGIAPEQQEKIFEFFVQADSSTQREYGGTGLGLAVSKQLIELHNGQLKVESVPGEGSVFSFTLEVAETGIKDKNIDSEVYERIPLPEVIEQDDFTVSEDVHKEAEIEQDPTEDLATILIVDDEPVVHHVLEQHLATKGYRLLNAKNGSQALDILESKDVDLVLLDIMMPLMTGYEVCHTIRKTKSREDLPIIFLSAKDRARDRVASFDEGGNDYLTKPIGKSELLARVETHLELLKVYRGQEDEIRELRDILPICSWCKKIRDDEGFWSQLEAYFHRNMDVQFSHGICPDCMKKEQAKIRDT